MRAGWPLSAWRTTSSWESLFELRWCVAPTTGSRTEPAAEHVRAGAGEDFTRLLLCISRRMFYFRFLCGIRFTSSADSSDHVEAPFTHVWWSHTPHRSWVGSQRPHRHPAAWKPPSAVHLAAHVRASAGTGSNPGVGQHVRSASLPGGEHPENPMAGLRACFDRRRPAGATHLAGRRSLPFPHPPGARSGPLRRYAGRASGNPVGPEPHRGARRPWADLRRHGWARSAVRLTIAPGGESSAHAPERFSLAH